MIKKISCLILLLQLGIILQGFAKKPKKHSTYITLNTNSLLPIGKNLKKQFAPIYLVENGTRKQFALQGYGLGIQRIMPYKKNLDLKFETNLSKTIYWSSPVYYTDIYANPMGTSIAAVRDIVWSVSGLAQYNLNKHWAIGGGLSIRNTITSLQALKYSNPRSFKIDSSHIVASNPSKLVMPAIPVELTYKFKKHQMSLRYDQAILNNSRRNLTKYIKDFYGVFAFTFAFKL